MPEASPDLYEIVSRLGGRVYAGGREAQVPGPGHSRRDRGIHLTRTNDGRIIYCSFQGDNGDAKAVFDYLGIQKDQGGEVSREEWARQRREREAWQRQEDARKLAFCQQVWAGTAPLGGTPGDMYLRSRGVELVGCSDVRWHPAAPRAMPRAPTEPPPPPPHSAIVAMVRNAAGAGTGLHATYITDRGRKAFANSRLMFGKCVGGAVRLAPIGPDGVLGLCEGLETSGAFSALNQVPTWAVLSTAGLRGFVLPSGVKRLLIGVDMDDDGSGLRAGEEQAQVARRRCDVALHKPPAGKDWHDVFVEAGHG